MIIAAMITAIVIGLVKAYRFTKNQGSGSGQNGSELMALFEFIAIVRSRPPTKQHAVLHTPTYSVHSGSSA
jgi:hypothetical protein